MVMNADTGSSMLISGNVHMLKIRSECCLHVLFSKVLIQRCQRGKKKSHEIETFADFIRIKTSVCGLRFSLCLFNKFSVDLIY